jgi:hypothetical protein
MRTVRLAAAVAAALVAVVTAEAIARWLDGYAIFSVALRRIRYEYAQPSETPDRQYLPVSLASGVNAAWYEQDPPPIAPYPVSPEIQARSRAYPTDNYAPFFWWNAAYVRGMVCTGQSVADLDDFYTFEPVDGQPWPTFRSLPHVNPPGWFTPNAFGWRGPEITAARPPNTIRIAFVGASTTSDEYASPFSHPEMVGYWLNLWASAKHLPYTFQVINAARTGLDVSSLEAIVRTEVLSVDPDLIVYYEGANNFAPGLALQLPPQMPAKPKMTFRKRSRAEDYSAIAIRTFDAVLKTGQDGSEPRKPAYALKWPAGVDENNPDPSRPRLPMSMQVVVAKLDSIREALSGTGTELALASFVWMVYPGMRLDLTHHLVLFRYLNETYWPATYAHLRRMADFQNRIFRNYAQRHQLLYLPMDEAFPHDPDLFGDAVHMTARGRRLRGWFYLQQLIPIIEARIASHQWPKAPSPRPTSAAWAAEPPKLLSKASILASCPVR